ncbi:MAG: uracil-DNA glycosylase [Deltaproteobacteria bacterium]|nr:uracil-DNA glycosylase [Deltaproteobacteria bacterium]
MRQIRNYLKSLEEIGITELHLPKKPELVSSTSPEEALQKIREEIGDCTRCKLCEKRTNIVFGVGNPRTKLMFVGEGPGRDEDIQGEPFVGRSGQLLTKMIEAMGLKRSDIYIGNIVKCRPPDNRYPELEEVETCFPFLLKQINAIHPKIIVTLGNLASQVLLNTKTGITSLRGRFHDFYGIQVMPTYHPAFLLRNPNMKKPCWEDLQMVMAAMGLKK